MERWMRLMSIICGVILGLNAAAFACTDPPCDISTSACSLSSGSVKRDTVNPFSVTLELCFSNVDGPCGGSPVVIPGLVLSQLDSFGDAVPSLTGIPFTPFTIPVDTTVCGSLTLTFPASAPAGERSFGLCISDPNCPNSVPDCTATVDITESVRVVPIEPAGCTLPDVETKRTFRIFNCTAIARTVDFTVTSIQTATTAFEDGDHFPISICPAPVPPGDPLDPIPPVLASTVIVPAGVGSYVDVAIASRSFPTCHEGSNCKYRFTAVDQATGEQSQAESTLMVINSTWNKLDGELTGSVGTNVLTVNLVNPFLDDDMESGAANWVHGADVGVDDWAIINTINSCSPPNAWFSADEATIKDVHLDTLPLQLPAGGAILQFNHIFNMESTFDGCVLEASIDGAPFIDIGNLITENGYNGTISTLFSSPIAGQRAWTGQIFLPCMRTTVDLSSFGNSRIVVRFRLACDNSTAGEGWYIDDVRVAAAVADDPCVVVGVGQPITVNLDASPAGPVMANYVLWVWGGPPASPTILRAGQNVFGLLANPSPLNLGGPQPFRCVRGGLPASVCAGVTEVNGPAKAPWSLTKASGLGQPTTLTLQALMQDDGALNNLNYSVTNAVILKVQ